MRLRSTQAFRFRIALLAALTLGSLTAQASTSTASVASSVTLNSDCALTVNGLNFGTSSALQPSNVNATTTMQVNCSSGTPYTIAIGASTTVLNGTTYNQTVIAPYNHAMTSTTVIVSGRPITLPYNITQDAAGAQPWGYTVGTDTVGGVGTGGLTTLQVYAHESANSGAQLTGRPTPAQADTYIDLLTVTLSY